MTFQDWLKGRELTEYLAPDTMTSAPALPGITPQLVMRYKTLYPWLPKVFNQVLKAKNDPVEAMYQTIAEFDLMRQKQYSTTTAPTQAVR